MAFSNASDANVFLDGTTMVLVDGQIDNENTDAEMMIRAYLTNRVPAAVMATWTDATHTPELVRQIAGRFVAAICYRRAISGNDSAVDPYAAGLYNEAMAMLQGIIAGTINIPEVPPGTLLDTRHLAQGMYYPNNNADVCPDPSSTGNTDAIKFRIGADF